MSVVTHPVDVEYYGYGYGSGSGSGSGDGYGSWTDPRLEDWERRWES